MIHIDECNILLFGQLEWLGVEETGHLLRFNMCEGEFIPTSSSVIGTGIEAATYDGNGIIYVVGPITMVGTFPVQAGNI